MAPANKKRNPPTEDLEYQPSSQSQKRRMTNSAGMGSGRGIQKALAQDMKADRAQQSSRNPKGMDTFCFIQ